MQKISSLIISFTFFVCNSLYSQSLGSENYITLEEVFVYGNNNYITLQGVYVSSPPQMTYWEIQNFINDVNNYYHDNPGVVGCDNQYNSTAYFDQCQNCVGGLTGLPACTPPPPPDDPVDPCSNFKDWVSNNSHGGGSYYDNNKGFKVLSGVCTNENQSCILDERYWYIDGSTKFYHRDVSGVLGIGASHKWIQYFDCGISCLPIELDYVHSATPANGITNTGWCVFACLETLKGGSACTYATYYYSTFLTANNITGCNANTGVDPGNVVPLFTHFGLTPTSVTINDECGMINALKDGGKAILDIMPNHMALVYGVHRDRKGKVTIDYYSTLNANGYDQSGADFSVYQKGGGDYVVQ